MSTSNTFQSSNQGTFASQEEMQRNNKHAPGVKVGNDAVPEFHAQTIPAGTAPADRTFIPNTDPQTDVPGAGHPQTGKETFVSAADSIVGATSADVHTGIGKPIQGQSSSEANSNRLGSKGGSVLANESDNFKDRGLDVDHRRGGTANASTVEEKDDLVGAGEKMPETAESVAAEFD